jgi:hypothetical protein
MTKRGRLALLGTVALMELQEQARFERAMARFEPDDDLLPPEADPMASAQSRRLPVEIHQ